MICLKYVLVMLNTATLLLYQQILEYAARGT